MNGVDNNLVGKLSGGGASPGISKSAGGAGGAGAASFSDMLKDSINEVAKLQQDASQAVQAFATGENKDITSALSAMEKSDVAFKTLLAIRGKLMEAYEEIKNIPV